MELVNNAIFNQIFSHKSIRRFDTEFDIPQKDIQKIVKAGQQASTSCTGQFYTIIEIKNENRDKVKSLCGDQDFVKDASFFCIICVDTYRLNKIVELSGGEQQDWPMASLLIGVFDAGLMAQNMVLAAESMGYGVCFCGSCGDKPNEMIDFLDLPEGVMPLTGLAIGKALEKPPQRPRLPLSLVLHPDKYPDYNEDDLEHGIKVMSEKLDQEGYYKKYSQKDNYRWRDHMKNKFGGNWLNIIEDRRIQALKRQKFMD